MDWSRFGSAFVQMEADSWKIALDAWPRFDRRYFEQAEQVFERLLSETRATGVASPTGLIICLVWLSGFLMARLPRPLRWAEVIVTLLWIAGALRASARASDLPVSPRH